MPSAVTVASGYPKYNVNGSMAEYYYKFDIAADADYLDVPMKNVIDTQMTDDTIQACGVASVTLTGGLSRIVFNSGGAITNCYLRVTGHL